MPDVATIDRIQEEIQFDSRYREPLVSRTKHGTVREGRRVPARMTLAVRISQTGEVLGNARIEEVRWIRLSEVTSPEIMKTEYPTEPRALLDDLRELYPRIRNTSWVTFFRFKFEDEA